MTELYVWTSDSLVYVALLLVLCVLTQTLLVIVSYDRRPRNPLRRLENILELSVLFHGIVLSLPIGLLHLSRFAGLFVPIGYHPWRYGAALLVILLNSMVMIISSRVHLWPTTAVACLAMPIAETFCGSSYVWVYIAILLFLPARSVYYAVTRYREIESGFSAHSVKLAVDSLHTGVLFSEREGFIALVNVQMQNLMISLTGRLYRNANYFYDALASGALAPGCRTTKYEGQIVCLLPNGAAWLFTRTPIDIQKTHYIQLSAADISERWALTAELQHQEALLVQKSEELHNMITNLQSLSQSKELQNAKLRAHDVLGKRLTVLLHIAGSGQTTDYTLLRTQLQNLREDLKTSQSAASPKEKLEDLQSMYAAIGVDIHLDGSLPENDLAGYIFVDIISESVVNAIRHGYATQVFVRNTYSQSMWIIEITDNGNAHANPHPIREGGGISGIRGKVEPRGGSLWVTNDPRYTLKVVLPGGVENV